MKLQSLLHSRKTLGTVSVLALATGLLAVRANADQWDKKTILTVSEPIQVRDTYLEPGQYVLKLFDSQGDRHIVQIFNADQSRIIDTVMAIPKQRMEPAGKSQFTFWETPPGTARAMRDWFYPGETIGQEFPYPKHLLQLAVATTPPPAPLAEPAPAPVPEPPSASAAPLQPDNSEAAGVSEEAEQPMEPQPPVETAQNAPPPEPAPGPPPLQQPTELPKTASPYPLIGLWGLAMLALAGLLKLKQSA